MLTALLYDPSCVYEVGALLWHEQYRTLATIQEIKPGATFSLAVLSFLSPGARALWRENNGMKVPTFGIDMQGSGRKPTIVRMPEPETPPAPRPVRPTMAERARAYKPDDSDTREPLPQAPFKALILDLARENGGTVSTRAIQDAVLARLSLSAADWSIRSSSAHPVWVHRIGSAIKHLQRVGLIARVGEAQYQLAGRQPTAPLEPRRVIQARACPFCGGITTKAQQEAR